MRLNWLLAFFAMGAFALPANAQDVVGSSIVNGRSVQILSDFTWRYTTATPSECQTIKAGVTFCGERSGWKRSSQGSKDLTATFRLDDRNYGLFVVEDLGSEDGVTHEMMRTAIIGNAANSSGMQPTEIAIVGPERRQVDGFAGESISYTVQASGLPFVFMNTVVIDKHRTVQLATYGVGPTLTDEMKANHQSFLNATRLK